MSVATVTEITAASPNGFQDAIQNGLERASQTLRNVKGAWVNEQRVVMDEGKISEYRVNMKVSFVLDD